MRYIVKAIPQSGIPLGGIGAGYFEIRADGEFYEWQIFNNRPWRMGGAKEELMDQDDFFFAIRVKAKEENVEEIEYVGEYPLVTLNFKDPSLPIEVSLTAYSPFIPGDIKNSSLPAAILSFRVKNPSNVEVSLLGALKNPVGHGVKGAAKVNKVEKVKGVTRVTMSAKGVPESHITHRGSITLAVMGDDVTYRGLMEKSIDALRRMWVDLRTGW